MNPSTSAPASGRRLVCRGCGRTEDAGADSGAGCPSAAAGFRVERAEVVFWGWCPACRERRPVT